MKQVALLEAAAGSVEGKKEGEGGVSAELLEVVPKSLEGFDAGMNDDLNTPRYAWSGSAQSRARCAQSQTCKMAHRSV